MCVDYMVLNKDTIKKKIPDPIGSGAIQQTVQGNLLHKVGPLIGIMASADYGR